MSFGEERDLVPLGAGFDISKRGYSRPQVDEHLERLDADLKMLTSDRDAAISQAGDLARQLEDALNEIEVLRGQVERLAQPPTSLEGLSVRLQKMVRAAQDEASETKARAEAEAGHIRAKAEADASAMRTRYDQMLADLDTRRQEMEAEHRELMERARQEAEAIGWNDDRFRVISHRSNFGKTEAILTGAASTGADWLVIFDADLQHSADEIPRFLARLDEGWDIVTGRKIGAYEKKVVSDVYNRLNRVLFGIPVTDLNSMKAFRREILEEVHLRHDWHRFFVVLAYARGFSVTEIDIDLFPRRAGQAKYSGRGRIVVGFLDLLSVAFFLFFARKPMMFFGLSGLVLVFTGVLVGLATIALRVAAVMPPFGFRPLLYLVILLETVGFLLFGFGFLAEMIAQQRSELDALSRRLRRRPTVPRS
jgi:cell division septum initiation protein DivIVA